MKFSSDQMKFSNEVITFTEEIINGKLHCFVQCKRVRVTNLLHLIVTFL